MPPTKRSIATTTNPIRKQKVERPKMAKLDPRIFTFQINANDLVEFQRAFPHNNDCVINALQIANHIDSKIAAAMRTLSQHGGGIRQTQIEHIFTRLTENRDHFKFEKTSEHVESLLNKLEESCAMFLGVQWVDGSQHVVLITKTGDHQLVLIDPQRDPAYDANFDLTDWKMHVRHFYLLTLENVTNYTTPPKFVKATSNNVVLTGAQLAVFPFSRDHFDKFRRGTTLPKTKYIIVNSFRLINYLNPHALSVLQCAVTQDVGLSLDDVAKVLTVLNGSYKFTFKKQVKNKKKWFNDIVTRLRPGFATYCGVKWLLGGAHPLLLVKTSTKCTYIINPCRPLEVVTVQTGNEYYDKHCQHYPKELYRLVSRTTRAGDQPHLYSPYVDEKLGDPMQLDQPHISPMRED